MFADCLSDPGKLLDHVLASRQTLRALFQQTNIEKKSQEGDKERRETLPKTKWTHGHALDAEMQSITFG